MSEIYKSVLNEAKNITRQMSMASSDGNNYGDYVSAGLGFLGTVLTTVVSVAALALGK